MADNIVLNAGSGGATMKTDDDGTAHWQYVKLAFGADNTQTPVGSISSNPLPVALSATDNAVLDAALTALQLIDDPVFADDAAFTLASSKVSMAGAIRDDALTTLTAVEGDAVPLRVSSTGALHVTGGGGGTEYTEDVATANPIVGTATVMERDDALSTLTPIEGDWAAMRCSAEGALWVQEFNSDAILADTANMDTNLATIAGAVAGTEMQVDIVSGNVTNAGTFAVQVDGAALTALQLIDDAIFTDDAVYTAGTDKGVMIMGFAGPQTVNSGDAAALACNTSGALHVNLNSQTSDVTIADGGNSITVDNGGTFAVQVDAALPAGTNAIGKLAANSGVDIGDVDVTSLIPGTGATALGKAIDSAAGGTDTGVAVLAIRDDEQAAITPVDGDYTNLTVDKFGKLKATLHPDATSVPKRAVIDTGSSGDNTLVAAAGAGVKIRVTSVLLVATGTVNCRFESGASGTALTGQMNLVANTGFALPFNPDGWFETADNTLLNLELSAAVGVDGCLTYVEV